MPDPRIKIPTKPITVRLPHDVWDKLEEMSEKHGMPKVQVLNTLVRIGYSKLTNMQPQEGNSDA